MRHAPVSISFSTRDLLSFFSFRAHLLGGGTRPPERTRLNSAVRHQLGSRFVLPWGSTDESGGPGRDHSSIRARWLMRTDKRSLVEKEIDTGACLIDAHCKGFAETFSASAHSKGFAGVEVAASVTM